MARETNGLPDLVALRDRVMKLPVADRLRLAAALAEAIVGTALEALQVARLARERAVGLRGGS